MKIIIPFEPPLNRNEGGWIKVNFDESSRLLTDAEAAEFLGISRSWLRLARCRGYERDAPPHVRLGRRVYYRFRDLAEWASQLG